MDRVTFIVAVNNRKILDQNLLASPCLRLPHSHQVIVQEGFTSAARAYNEGLDKAENDLVGFIHQDVFLPKSWMTEVDSSLRHLEEHKLSWGVLGCWGARADGTRLGHIYSSGLGVLGSKFEQPTRVQTLDEVVLIVRKSSGLRFHESLPGFHFYGTDICMSAAVRGLDSYLIPAFCIHNTRQILKLPRDFYDCYSHTKRRWGKHVPIQTTCIRISRFNSEVYWRRLKEFCHPVLVRGRQPAERVIDPREIATELQNRS